MAIFDCFQYFNEEHIAEIRFNQIRKTEFNNAAVVIIILHLERIPKNLKS